MSYRYCEPDIDKLQRIIDYRRFIELLAYEKINPRGEWRDDLRMARTCAVIANSSGFRQGPPARESDYMPDFNGEIEQQSPEEMKAWGKRLAAMGEFD